MSVSSSKRSSATNRLAEWSPRDIARLAGHAPHPEGALVIEAATATEGI